MSESELEILESLRKIYVKEFQERKAWIAELDKKIEVLKSG